MFTHCVRLEQGDMTRAAVFNLDPATQAKSGSAWIRRSARRSGTARPS
jgi:hypothetical protein